MGYVIGDPVNGEDLVVRDFTVDATGVTKGDVVVISSGTVTTATASLDGPYGVALETYAANAVNARVAIAGTIYVKASGTVTVGGYVSAAADGDVAAFSKETISTTPTQADVQNVQNKILRIVGKCMATTTTGLAAPIKLGFQ